VSFPPPADPFTKKSAAPRSPNKLDVGLVAGAALLAGIAMVVAYKKGNLWSPYRAPPAPTPPPPKPSAGRGYSPSQGYTPAVPQPAADTGAAPVDPSQMVASFGDAPAHAPGDYYDMAGT
jgi:hypothetical protein